MSLRTTLLTAALLPALAGAAHAQTVCQAAVAPGGLFAYDAAAPLAYRDTLEGVEDGISVYSVSFDSPRGGRATGVLHVPAGPGPHAGILLGHGAPGSARAQGPRARYLARKGAVVLAIDAPFARRGDPPLAFTPRDSADLVQWIVDLRRGVDVLLARPDVDPARLAFVGRSYGGSVGGVLVPVETRLRGGILAVADGGVGHHFSGANPQAALLRDLPPGAAERWLASLRALDGRTYVPCARPGSLLFQSATDDEAVHGDDARALHAAAGSSHRVLWYATGHRLDARAYADQLGWLHAHLGTAAPDGADRAGPVFPPAP